MAGEAWWGDPAYSAALKNRDPNWMAKKQASEDNWRASVDAIRSSKTKAGDAAFRDLQAMIKVDPATWSDADWSRYNKLRDATVAAYPTTAREEWATYAKGPKAGQVTYKPRGNGEVAYDASGQANPKSYSGNEAVTYAMENGRRRDVTLPSNSFYSDKQQRWVRPPDSTSVWNPQLQAWTAPQPQQPVQPDPLEVLLNSGGPPHPSLNPGGPGMAQPVHRNTQGTPYNPSSQGGGWTPYYSHGNQQAWEAAGSPKSARPGSQAGSQQPAAAGGDSGGKQGENKPYSAYSNQQPGGAMQAVSQYAPPSMYQTPGQTFGPGADSIQQAYQQTMNAWQMPKQQLMQWGQQQQNVPWGPNYGNNFANRPDPYSVNVQGQFGNNLQDMWAGIGGFIQGVNNQAAQQRVGVYQGQGNPGAGYGKATYNIPQLVQQGNQMAQNGWQNPFASQPVTQTSGNYPPAPPIIQRSTDFPPAQGWMGSPTPPPGWTAAWPPRTL